MQTKIINNVIIGKVQQLRLNREILYDDLIQQLKYLKDKQISMVKCYKEATNKIDKELEALLSAGVKNGKNKQE